MSPGHARFHAGEIAVQERADVGEERRLRAAAGIRPVLPEQHRVFFENLPILFLAYIDAVGRPWATFAAGSAGFVRSSDPEHLTINAGPALAKELRLAIGAGSKIGVLGIELPTRRRNRMNGTIIHSDERNGATIKVDQSFGNCPQYIQKRSFDQGADLRTPVPVCALDALSPAAVEIIQAADTFFIASRTATLGTDAAAGLDVSHRGGRPGFLHINSDGSLSFPDFSGNRFFNTLGNIADDGRVGMLVPQFATGDALFLTGSAAIDWDSNRVRRFEGAERIIDVKPASIYFARHVLPATATLIEMSSRLDGTGNWPETSSTIP